MKRNTYEIIYNRLDTLGLITPDPESIPHKSISKGWMDLNYDYLGFRGHEETSYDIALAHNYIQNGDVMADPDMEIRILTKYKWAEALSFRQDNLGIYQEVYLGDGRFYPKLQKELNDFLKLWLRNCINQKHSFKLNMAA